MSEAVRTGQAAFGDRLAEVFAGPGHLCVGIDPHTRLLRDWGLPLSAAGVREFGLRVVSAAAGRAGLVKPQVAFFERFGSDGYAALEEVIRAARAAGLLVIADAKRGDIGTTVEAYGEAWLPAGAPLEADALTLSAYQGVGSIASAMTLAEEHGKGLFVLAVTSNREAGAIQRARVGEPVGAERATTPGGGASGTPGAAPTVARVIIDEVCAFNRAQGDRALGSVGLVLGATADLASFQVDLSGLAGRGAPPILAPGFGSQGADLAEAARIFGPAAGSVIVAESRSILEAGPDALAQAIGVHAAQVRKLS